MTTDKLDDIAMADVPNIEVLDVTKLVEREGFKCRECGHKHAGKTLDYICVGCPCDFIPALKEKGNG